jgi:hypothetical protein
MQIGSGISIGPGITVNGPAEGGGGGGGSPGNYSTSGLILNLDAGNTSSFVSGASVWNDLSGNGYTANVSFSMKNAWVDVGALTANAQNYLASYFDLGYRNTNRYADIGDTTGLRPTGAVTYEIIAGGQGALTNRQTYLTIANGPKLGISEGGSNGSSGTSYFEFEVNGQTTSNSSPAIYNSTYNTSFFHLIGTYDGTTIRTYLNGTEVATASYSGAITYDDTYKLYVDGYRTDTPSGNPDKGKVFGFINVVRVYNRALTSTEVSYNYSWAKGTRPGYNLP